MHALAGWERHSCRDGVIVRSPNRATQIRIRPRVASPLSPRVLIERTVETAFGGGAVAHAPIERVITAEGELALLASAQVEAGARAVGISVAIVGDEPCLCIEAIGVNHREHAGALMRSLGLGLSPLRRRWFAYTPPAGWLGTRRGDATQWRHPADPRVQARITVFDARPHVDAETEQLHRLFVRLPEGLHPLAPPVVEDVTSTHGLTGRLRHVVGTLADAHRTLRMASVHADDRFSYLATVEGPDDPAIERAFRDVIASFGAVPRRSL